VTLTGVVGAALVVELREKPGEAPPETPVPPDPVVGGRFEVAADVTGTSSRGARAHTAVKARTVTPSLVRLNRCRIRTALAAIAKGGLFVQPRMAHSDDSVPA
jgi:hypothetical protein